jgi:hypothetical protein
VHLGILGKSSNNHTIGNLKRRNTMASLAEIRARLQAAESNKGSNQSTGGGDNAIYPHWNMEEGATATVRFLPDGNAKNTFFWVERAMIKLPFAGVKGEMESKQVVVQVPCVEMYGDGTPCPILAEVRTWFKDKSLEEMGRKYWKKRSYIFQGFVRENPIGDDKTPENPVRRFIIGPQIFNIIKSALMDPELEELPTDLLRGLDFKISKSSKGGYADYSTSKWSRKDSALTEAEQAALQAHGLYNLNDFLPKKPTDVELKVMKEMFEASVDGQPYDPDRWGQYFRPAGMTAPSGSAPAPAPVAEASAQTAPSAVASQPAPFDTDEDDAPVASAPVQAKPSTQKAEDILAMIRARQSK